MRFFRRLLQYILPKKIIEVDDSGSGSIYGGILILVTDGKEDFHKEVPLSLFAVSDKGKRSQLIRENICEIIKAGLKKLDGNKNSTQVHLCQGSIFDYAAAAIKRLGYKVKRKKILGRTNERAEELFKELLQDKYDIRNYNPKDYKKENLRQFATLKKRRDFKNVKVNSKGVRNLYDNP